MGAGGDAARGRPAVALAALALGAVLLLEATLGRGAVFWPIAIGLTGVALLWRQADEAQRERWLDTTGRVDPVRVVLGSGGWASYARIAAGGLLLVAAVFIVGFDNGGQAQGVLVAALLGVAALAVVVGPWVYRLASDLSAEREERVRSQERADAQERDLRAWLFAGDTTDAATVSGALRAVTAELEDAHGISVDVVVVGECPMTEGLRPLVAATREAVTNAAKHAGTGRVDVYAEVGPSLVEVFVRDRGAGFDLDSVPEDRQGVRGSIVDRMTRHGGRAEVRTASGEGTEVRLAMPRQSRESQSGEPQSQEESP